MGFGSCSVCYEGPQKFEMKNQCTTRVDVMALTIAKGKCETKATVKRFAMSLDQDGTPRESRWHKIDSTEQRNKNEKI